MVRRHQRVHWAASSLVQTDSDAAERFWQATQHCLNVAHFFQDSRRLRGSRVAVLGTILRNLRDERVHLRDERVHLRGSRVAVFGSILRNLRDELGLAARDRVGDRVGGGGDSNDQCYDRPLQQRPCVRQAQRRRGAASPSETARAAMAVAAVAARRASAVAVAARRVGAAQDSRHQWTEQLRRHLTGQRPATA